MDKATVELIVKLFFDDEPNCPYDHEGCGHWSCEAGQRVKKFGGLE